MKNNDFNIESEQAASDPYNFFGNKDMASNKLDSYLLKAINALNRKVIVISPEFIILDANSFAFENKSAGSGTNRLPTKHIIGKKCFKVLYDRSSPCKACPATVTIRTHKPALEQKKSVKFNYEYSSCQYSYPIITDGKLEAVLALDIDHPDLEIIEEKLRQSNAFLKNLILSSVDGVIASDMTGKILIFNKAAAEISGYSIATALESLNIRELYAENGAREVMRKLRSRDHGGKGKLKSCKVEILTLDKQIVPVRLNASVVYESKEEVATIGFFHDLREEIRIQNKLQKTNTQLLQAEKMTSLGKLAAGVAHQLNNPIGSIMLFAQLLLDAPNMSAEAQEDLHHITRDAQRCKDIVRELLEFAHPTNYNIQPIDINETILKTLQFLEKQTIFQNIKITKKLTTPLRLVPADSHQMNHVFTNIILNAADAIDGKGQISIKTSENKHRDAVRIEITDNGSGISEDNIANIFEPFFTTKAEGKGTGLGLSIVYGIIKAHNGKIRVKSDPGQYTTFTIDLPLT